MKDNHVNENEFKDNSDITSEACAWIAQLETGNSTRADMVAFKEWVSRSPKHASEIRRMAKMSMSLNSLSELAPAITLASKEQQKVMQTRPSSRRKALLPAMAFVAGIIAIGLVYLLPTSELKTVNYVTRVGESKVITLSDTSTVNLNTDTRIEVTFSDDNRVVKLVKGEAYFDVASNPSRPFWVYSAQDRVKVVGTEFLIRVFDDKFKLMVNEGVVNLAAVTRESSLDGKENLDKIIQQDVNKKAIEVTAGQLVETTKGVVTEQVKAISKKEQRRELSWREGLHDFTDMTLSDVAKEVSRYSAGEVIVTDPSLQQLRFSGIFRIGEPQQFFDALKISYGLNVVRLSPDTVEIRLP